MKSVFNDQTCPPARMCRDVSPPDGGEQEADVEHIVTQHDAHIKSRLLAYQNKKFCDKLKSSVTLLQ